MWDSFADKAELASEQTCVCALHRGKIFTLMRGVIIGAGFTTPRASLQLLDLETQARPIQLVARSALTSLPPASTPFPFLAMSVKPKLPYHRKWSRKNLHDVSSVAISEAGQWLAVAEASTLAVFASTLAVFDAGTGELVVKVNSPISISRILWLSATSLVCCCTEGTIMTVYLTKVCPLPAACSGNTEKQ